MHTGALEIYGVKKVVESVQDPVKEISLDDAQRMDPGGAAGIGSPLPQADRRAWAAFPLKPPSR